MHYIVTATVDGELLYVQSHEDGLDMADDVRGLLLEDPMKVVTVKTCLCAGRHSERPIEGSSPNPKGDLRR